LRRWGSSEQEGSKLPSPKLPTIDETPAKRKPPAILNLDLPVQQPATCHTRLREGPAFYGVAGRGINQGSLNSAKEKQANSHPTEIRIIKDHCFPRAQPFVHHTHPCGCVHTGRARSLTTFAGAHALPKTGVSRRFPRTSGARPAPCLLPRALEYST
jgi:hypothetical protein